MPAPVRRKLSLVLAACALALAAAGVAAASNGGFGPPTPHSPNAQGINDTYYLILGFTAFIFLLVEGTLVFLIVRYRSRGRARDVDGFQIHGHTRTELLWTAGPVVILAVIAAFVFYKLPGIKNIPAANAANEITVKVEGRQYFWQFTYPNGAISIDQLHVPVHEVVVLDIISRDVNHSWWIYQLGGKWDAIPGRVNQTWMKVDDEGVYQGQCSELCGIQHAAMLATVVAESRDKYDAFVNQRAAQPTSVDLGREEAYGVCAKCHYLQPNKGTLVGPDLAGNPTLTNLTSLTKLVRTGKGAMPPVGKYWTDAQIEALVNYFKSGGASGGQG
jgi:cytochrome c oxidase subunit 2